MTVRTATIQDAELIARFNQAMAMETESKALDWGTISAGVERMVRNPELGFYLVFEPDTGGQITGCLGITFEWSDWRNGLFWWIQSVYVSPDSREQGVFTAMYHEVQKQPGKYLMSSESDCTLNETIKEPCALTLVSACMKRITSF